MADLLGLKQKFSQLVHSVQPWMLAHFIMWLDLKIAEYKVHGYMILDEEATTGTRQQDTSPAAPVTILVDRETSSLSQQDRQLLLYQNLSSQLNLPVSNTAISISQTRPSEVSKHSSPGLASSSKSHQQQAGRGPLGGARISHSNSSVSGDERDPRYPSPSLAAVSSSSLGRQGSGALASSGRLGNSAPGCSFGGGVHANIRADSSHVKSQGLDKTLSSPFLRASAGNPTSLSQPVTVSQFSRGSFSRGSRIGNYRGSYSKWRAIRRPYARGTYTSVNGAGLLLPDQSTSHYSSSTIPSQHQSRAESDVILMQRNHQPGADEQDSSSVIVCDDDDDDHTESKKSDDVDMAAETSAGHIPGSEEGRTSLHKDMSSRQQQAEFRSASYPGERTTNENTEAGESSQDFGLPLSFTASLETNTCQGPLVSQQNGGTHSSTVTSLTDATSTASLDTSSPASASKMLPNNSSSTNPGRWPQQPVEFWPSAAAESSTVRDFVTSVKEEPDSSEYEHSLQPVVQLEVDGTILGNLLDYPGPPQGPEAGQASGSGVGQEMQWASGSELLGSQSAQAFPDIGRSAVSPRKFSSMVARRALAKNTNIQSAERVVCHVCGATFRFKSSLSRHKALHAEKRFHCFVCSKAFHRKEHLMHHLNRQHDKMASSRCPVCQQQLSSLRQLEDHFYFCHGTLGGRGGLFGRQLQSVIYQS